MRGLSDQAKQELCAAVRKYHLTRSEDALELLCTLALPVAVSFAERQARSIPTIRACDDLEQIAVDSLLGAAAAYRFESDPSSFLRLLWKVCRYKLLSLTRKVRRYHARGIEIRMTEMSCLTGPSGNPLDWPAPVPQEPPELSRVWALPLNAQHRTMLDLMLRHGCHQRNVARAMGMHEARVSQLMSEIRELARIQPREASA